MMHDRVHRELRHDVMAFRRRKVIKSSVHDAITHLASLIFRDVVSASGQRQSNKKFSNLIGNLQTWNRTVDEPKLVYQFSPRQDSCLDDNRNNLMDPHSPSVPSSPDKRRFMKSSTEVSLPGVDEKEKVSDSSLC
jgi:hypothetical protein